MLWQSKLQLGYDFGVARAGQKDDSKRLQQTVRKRLIGFAVGVYVVREQYTHFDRDPINGHSLAFLLICALLSRQYPGVNSVDCASDMLKREKS